MAVAFRSMEAGAVACVEKPRGARAPAVRSRCVENLLQTVRLMSEVKVVRRWPRRAPAARTRADRGALAGDAAAAARIVGIGASTGGPPVLQTILSALPTRLSRAAAHRAAHRARLPAGHGRVAEPDYRPAGAHRRARRSALPGHVYIAPDDFHLGVSTGGRLMLARDEPENGLRPAVSYLFRSLAENLRRRLRSACCSPAWARTAPPS